MEDWVDFCFNAISSIVSMFLDIDFVDGVSLGGLIIALLVIGIIGSALIVKSAHIDKGFYS